MKQNDHIESCPVDEHLAYKMEKKALLKKRRAEETKPIPAIYFYFCQAVHRKVGELGLKTRYRQHEETRRKIRMLLATAFLPVPHVNTGVSLLEAGTT
ncbi:hypothetical protein T01_5842, partial [Trichinella spiralis]